MLRIYAEPTSNAFVHLYNCFGMTNEQKNCEKRSEAKFHFDTRYHSGNIDDERTNKAELDRSQHGYLLRSKRAKMLLATAPAARQCDRSCPSVRFQSNCSTN